MPVQWEMLWIYAKGLCWLHRTCRSWRRATISSTVRWTDSWLVGWAQWWVHTHKVYVAQHITEPKGWRKKRWYRIDFCGKYVQNYISYWNATGVCACMYVLKDDGSKHTLSYLECQLRLDHIVIDLAARMSPLWVSCYSDEDFVASLIFHDASSTAHVLYILFFVCGTSSTF